MPDYIVIRAAATLPAGFMPTELDGKWYDRGDLPHWVNEAGHEPRDGGAVAVPTGRFEVRDDGAVAEVFEVTP